MRDTVLLTGITGFLGGHVALELLNAGYKVRGSLRNPGVDRARAESTRVALAAAGADTTGLDFVTLDLTHDDGWAEAAEGARFVLHTASPFVTAMPKDPDELIRPAVDGTERALMAAKRAGVERVVLTSSSVAIVSGRGRKGPSHLGPDDWADPDSGKLNAYQLSKVLAERRAWQIAAAESLPLAVINPGFIVGPLLDDDPGTSGAILARLLKGGVPMLPELFMHTVDVRDLARIHVAALTDPAAVSRRHPAVFSSLSLLDYAALLAKAVPERAGAIPRRRAPDFIVRLMALFDSDMKTIVSELGYDPEIDSSRAAGLLGRPPTAIETTVGDMGRSLVARGLA
ncbi:NAD-dependent epimerase/dehydratase family protein [Martelella endophytica]|uniref:NAD-dependent epimerase/dehydratase domain-containing protein n=1 Tax=Martelella endophytica TaxID=1486262 RepID=A0A0D5LKW7_MAREN|nr:NAD-dependent epimerase/dehydratase family protein [Martelella endophytica]AJY44811.1 hypothetical protein TM49_02510 [Martelella endophytica]